MSVDFLAIDMDKQNETFIVSIHYFKTLMNSNLSLESFNCYEASLDFNRV